MAKAHWYHVQHQLPTERGYSYRPGREVELRLNMAEAKALRKLAEGHDDELIARIGTALAGDVVSGEPLEGDDLPMAGH